MIERILRAVGVDVTAATRTGQGSVSCVRDGAPADELHVQAELFCELFDLCDQVRNLVLIFVGVLGMSSGSYFGTQRSAAAFAWRSNVPLDILPKFSPHRKQ